MLTEEHRAYAYGAGLPKMYCPLSARGALHRLDSSLTSSSAQRKQIGGKCTMFVISWHVAYFPTSLVTLLFEASTPRGPPPLLRSAKKCSSTAPPRARANLYLDKQIDKQSTLFHYQAEKLTTSSGSESTAVVEESRGRRRRKRTIWIPNSFDSKRFTLAPY